MEVLIILPFVLLAMVLPTWIVLAVLIGSLALGLLPVAGGAFFVLVIKHFIG